MERLLALYTFLPTDEVRRLGQLQDADIRVTKETLAFETTKIVHGEAAAQEAQAASHALFGVTDGREEALEAVPGTSIELERLQDGVPLAVLLDEVGLCTSRSEARRLIEQGGAYVNDQRVEDIDAVIMPDHVIDGQILLRAGKKRYHRVDVNPELVKT